ncbi:sugar ABC transporter ATP-binding protein [Streptomyces sp. T028]|uniref:sugar ABC transporter ATP-binding protein n=1 Tax=Streptomyces sp. T028 TaxID=3394379 RepID=UPI003A86FDEF
MTTGKGPAAAADTPGGRGAPALVVRETSKTFGGNTVLDRVGLSVARSEVHALVGENGSGKSTLVKILAGYHEPDPGSSILVDGEPLTRHHPDASDRAGLRFVHQDLGLVGGLTTVENLGLGRGYGAGRGMPVRWSIRRREAEELLASLSRYFDVNRPVQQLAASERSAVAVARAVAPHRTPARVLVLDEPTANLPGPEVAQLFDLVRRVRERGIGVVLISHHLSEVFELADTVSVLRGGRVVATVPVAATDESELIELMVGRKVDRLTGRPPAGTAPVKLAARAVRGRSVHGVDLDVRAGEVLGVAGITGSGREELAPLLFGALQRQGTVTLEGTPVPPGRPDSSITAGMVLVPADRDANAVLHGHDVAENIAISRPRDFVRRLVYRRRLEVEETAAWVGRLDIRTPRPRSPLTQLSGGNSQKVVLARLLRLRPSVLLLDEPTQGVDIGAREEIHRRVEEAAAEGAAVLVCSTDNEELARLCTRVVVLSRGRVSAEFAAPVDPDALAAACLTENEGDRG